MSSNVIFVRTRAGNKFPRAKIGFLDDSYWQSTLTDCPTKLLRVIRKSLKKSVPNLAEKFNPNTHNLRYFGYRLQNKKDKLYIYVHPDRLEIDLNIAPPLTSRIKKEGFDVKPKTNYQAQAGWLTGWQVTHSTKNVEAVIKWLCKAFEGE